MFHNFVNYHNLPIAGRLKHFLPAREQVTKDPWVLQVTQGYLIEFMTEPAQTCTPVSMFTTQENQNLIDQEVQELLAKQAVHPVSPSSQHEQGFISSLFVVPKKGGGGGGLTDRYKLETLKHVSALRTLQNGVNQHVEGPFKKRRLSSKDRPEGCISDGTHLEGSPKIPSLSMEGLPFRVFLSPIWSRECSTSIHEINETSSVNFETKWRSPHSLFRRFSNNGRDTTARPATCSNNPKLAGRSGICSKLPQIRPHTLSRNRIPRVHSKFSESKLEPPDGQNQESPPKLPEVTGQPCCYSPGISKVLGPSVCLSPGSVSSTIKLSLPPTCKELSSEKTKILRSPCHSRPKGPSGSALVEGQPSCLEWKGPSPSTYRPYHRDRCLPQRMGCTLPRHFHGGTLVSERKQVSYKLPGVTSRVPGCQVFYQVQGKSPKCFC